MLTSQQKMAETAVAAKACSAQDMDAVDVSERAKLQNWSGRQCQYFLKIVHISSSVIVQVITVVGVEQPEWKSTSESSEKLFVSWLCILYVTAIVH